jgi:pimeloyl-ACP methyl ester carboxylesterase
MPVSCKMNVSLARVNNGQISSRNKDSQMEREYRIRLEDGRVLSVLELGDPKGKPVFYCHGFPGSRLEARLAAKAAGVLGLRVLAADRPGVGGSTFQPGRTIGAWASDIAKLADRFELQSFDVVGVSGGGPYALACAAFIPERLNGVALISAVGPVSRGDSLHGMVMADRLLLGLAVRCPAVARRVVGALTRWIRRHPEFYLRGMLAGIPAADQEVLTDPAYRALLLDSTVQALRQAGRGPAWELTLIARPWDFRLEEIRVPVHIWQGLADNIILPVMARHMAAVLPGSESHYLSGEGHFSLIYKYHYEILASLCG